MKDGYIPVVRPIQKETYTVHCPICGREKWFSAYGKDVVQTKNIGADFVEYVTHRVDDVVCESCGREYYIDFGRETYTVYNPPKRKNSYQKCLTKFESHLHYNFELVASQVYEDEAEIFTVHCEREDYNFLIWDPFKDGLYKSPEKILELAKAHADRELYPK